MTSNLIELADWVAKVIATLAGAWGFVAAVLKPFLKWKIEQKIAAAAKLETRFLELIRGEMRPFYVEHDDLLEVAIDNRERQNETNDLLDAIGIRSGTSPECEEIRALIHSLDERRKARRRRLPAP